MWTGNHNYKEWTKQEVDMMENNQTLSGVTGRMMERFDPTVRKEKPEWILAQANTTATLVSALACFYRKVRIGNIGAGLRIHNEWTNRLVNFTND